MHKKLAADLTSLAHRILQMKNKEDVKALKEMAHQLYEKLSVLAYVDEYIDTTPQATETKEELVAAIEQSTTQPAAEDQDEQVQTIEESADSQEETAEEEVEEILEENIQETDTLEVEDELDAEEKVQEEQPEEDDITATVEEEEMPSLFSDVPEASEEEVDPLEPTLKTASLEDELKDTLAVDVVADLFEKAPQKSLNDTLQKDIVIGLNDRITFVKNLFDGSQEDFNRVVSQLNTLKTEKEAKKFINKMVKPDYDWSEKEDVVERFMSIILRKFA